MKKQQELIKKHFEDLGAKVQFQNFNAKQNSVKGKIEMTNIIVSFQPDKKRRVILCSHYDTRPIADQEPDPRDWRKPFVSANDGGSGVAFLMELGNHMKDLKTNVGVDFVFFDGEEYIFETEGPNKDRYFFGSEAFREDLAASQRPLRLRRGHPARHDRRQESQLPARSQFLSLLPRSVQGSLGHRPRAKSQGVHRRTGATRCRTIISPCKKSASRPSTSSTSITPTGTS